MSADPAAGKGLIAAAKADAKAEEAAEKAVANSESVVLDGSTGEAYAPSEEEVVDYAVQLGMELPDDADLLYVALEGLQSELQAPWKPCASPEGEVYYFNFETGESLWDRPDMEVHRKQFMIAKAKARGGASGVGDLEDDDAQAEEGAAAAAAAAAGVKEEPSAIAIEAAHETSSDEEDAVDPENPAPGYDMNGDEMTPMIHPRPAFVPSLDFETLAAKLKEEEEKEKAAEEEAKRLASMPLPAGWETAESRSTGQTYYVNTQTGATQYEFPDGVAEVWAVFGASHTYGSKGIRDKPARRNSL